MLFPNGSFSKVSRLFQHKRLNICVCEQLKSLTTNRSICQKVLIKKQVNLGYAKTFCEFFCSNGEIDMSLVYVTGSNAKFLQFLIECIGTFWLEFSQSLQPMSTEYHIHHVQTVTTLCLLYSKKELKD